MKPVTEKQYLAMWKAQIELGAEIYPQIYGKARQTPSSWSEAQQRRRYNEGRRKRREAERLAVLSTEGADREKYRARKRAEYAKRKLREAAEEK